MRIEMMCLLLGAALAVPALCGTVISETDFTKNGKVMNYDFRTKGFGSFHGFLPKNWRENGCSWSKTRGNSQIVKDISGDYLKFSVSGAGTQYFTALPKLKKNCPYRLTAEIRNRTDSVVVLHLRAGKPYKVWGALSIPYSAEWKTWTKTFRFDTEPDPTIALMFQIRGNGEIDVRNIRLEECGEERRKLLTTDFSFAENTVNTAGKGSFRGPLPNGWKEDYTHFVKSSVQTEAVKTGSRKFLRFRTQGGSPQFQAPLHGLEAGKYYRLTFTGDNRTGDPVGFSLRRIDAPYTQYAYGSANGGSGWRTQSLILGVEEPVSAPAALFLTIRGEGELDLGELSLEELSPGDTVTKRPDAELRNFFRNSSFPLGLQSGWTQGIEPDSAVPGPSGEASLKLQAEPGKNIGLYSEPFNVADPKASHTASFAVRGSGNFFAEVISEKKTLKKVTFKPGERWTRITVPFTPSVDALAFGLHIRGSGTVWVDSFRVAPSSESDYRPMMENEVALAFPNSSASAARIQFQDEKPELRWHVSGPVQADAELRASITNLYGETAVLKPIPVSGKKRDGIINYACFPKRPYGQFRVEVRLFRDGQALSPVNEMVATRIVRPRFWGKDAPGSPFGIHVLPQPESLLAAKASGANWARLHDAGLDLIGWAFLEPRKGEWLFRDKELNAYRKAGLHLLGELGTAPEWASYFDPATRCDSGYFKQYFAPRGTEDFARYAGVVAKRYRGTIDEWFIWNEPWHSPFFAFGYNSKGRGISDRYGRSGKVCRTELRRL